MLTSIRPARYACIHLGSENVFLNTLGRKDPLLRLDNICQDLETQDRKDSDLRVGLGFFIGEKMQTQKTTPGLNALLTNKTFLKDLENTWARFEKVFSKMTGINKNSNPVVEHWMSSCFKAGYTLAFTKVLKAEVKTIKKNRSNGKTTKKSR